MLLLCATFPGNSKADEQHLRGRREGREQREQDNRIEDGREVQSLRDLQEGKKDFNCDIVINNSSILGKIIFTTGNRNWTNSGLARSGFIFLT